MYKKTIVIGSGPSGTSFVKALLNKNKKVAMIDVGYTKKDNLYQNNYDNYNPRLSKLENSYVEKTLKILIKSMKSILKLLDHFL